MVKPHQQSVLDRFYVGDIGSIKDAADIAAVGRNTAHCTMPRLIG